jgi:hypothetical protein
MVESQYIDFSVAVFFAALLIFLARDWLIDLIFYAQNNWDWDKDSGRTLLEGALPTLGKRSTNRGRVLFGLPFLILVVLFLLLFFGLR